MTGVIRKHFASVLAALTVVTVTGAWLMGMFEGSDPLRDVSRGELVAALIGFLAFVGGLIGIVLLIRQRIKPWTRDEMSKWQHIREQGRRAYLRDAIIRGLIFAFLALACLSIVDYLKSRSMRLILASAWIYGALFLVYLFGMYYAALLSWNANEKHYQKIADSPSKET